jgi:hypothetical protein
MDEFDRYFKHSPTDLPIELIRRHLTVVATSTDEFTDDKWFFCFSDRYSDRRGNHR